MLDVNVLVLSQAVQVEADPEQFKQVYEQALHVDTVMSKRPVLQGHAFDVRVLVATQAVQFEGKIEHLRHEYSQALQVDTPLS